MAENQNFRVKNGLEIGGELIVAGTTVIDSSGNLVDIGNITTSGYLRGPASFIIDPAAHGDDTGTVIIAGNLQVDGTTTTINSTTITLDDKNIVLASGAANAAAADGAGITIDGAAATLTYANIGDKWTMNKPLDVTGTATMDGLTVEGSSAVIASFARDGSDGDAIQIFNGGVGTTKVLGLGGVGNNGIITNQYGNIQLAPSGTTIATISATGIDVTGTITASGEIAANGGIALGDNDKATFGASDDLQIYHDGGNSIITNSTGNLIIRDSVGGNILIQGLQNQPSVDAIANGAVNLYYSGNAKLSTTATGIDVTGTATMDGLTVVASNALGTIQASSATDATLNITSAGITAYSLVTSGTDSSFAIKKDGAERMRIDTSGNVGIGRASISQPSSGATTLAIQGTDNNKAGAIRFYSADDSVQSYIYTDSSSGFSLNTTTSHPMVFRTASVERMRISSAGFVGIGTSSPTSGGGLTLSSSTTAQGFIDFKNTVDGDSGYIGNAKALVVGGTTNQLGVRGGTNGIAFSVGSAEAARIDSSGNVGIGISPVEQLHLGGRTHSVFELQSNSTSGTGRINFSDTTVRGQILYTHTDDSMSFLTSATERIRIDSSGSVGIGTSSPATKLHASTTGEVYVATIENLGVGGNKHGLWIKSDSTWSSSNLLRLTAGTSDTDTFIVNPDRVYISANVGIGTTAPASKLQITTATAGTIASTVAAGTNAGIYLEDNATPTDNYFVSKIHNPGNDTAIGGIKFAVSPDGGNYSWAGIQALTSTSGNAGSLGFYTSASNVSGNNSTERMRIIANGSVGIGTSSPASALSGSNVNLTMEDADGADIRFKRTSGVDFTVGVTSSNTAYVWNGGGHHMLFGTASTERMRIQSTGNVSIGGNTAPSYKLVVSNGNAAGIEFGPEYATDTNLVQHYDRTASAYMDVNNIAQNHRFGRASNEWMRITSTGNVGIGTSSPAYQLDTGTLGHNSTGELLLTGGNNASNDYTQTTLLRLRATSINPNRTIHDDAASVAEIRFNHADNAGNDSSGSISFYTNPNNYNTAAQERMRIAATGRVGIGTSSPDAWLQIEKDNNNSGNQFSVADTEGVSAAIRTYTHNGDPAGLILNHYYAQAGSGYEYMRYADIVANVGNGAGTTMRFITKNAANTFSTTVIDNNGKVGIGTSSPNQKLHVQNSSGTTLVRTEVASNSLVGFNIKKTGPTTQEWNIVDGATVNGRLQIQDVTDNRVDMTFDGTGNVGIGTTSPNKTLEVANAAGGATVSISTDQIPGSAAAKKYVTLDFTGYNNNQMAQIQSWDESSSTGYGFLTFSTRQNNSSLVEAMRINQLGYVGIGTTAPERALHVVGGIHMPNANVLSWDAADGTLRNTMYVDSGDDLIIGDTNFDDIYFSTGQKTKTVVIKQTTGNVGIGTTSPAAKLDITGNNSDIAFTFGNTVPNNPLHSNYYGGYSGIGMDQTTAGVRIAGNTGATATSLDIGYYTSGVVSHANWNSSVMVKNDSKVGIGTSSPDSKMHLYDGALHVQQTDGSDTWLGYGANNDNYITTGASGITVFRAVGTERMRIHSAGGLSIGTTAAAPAGGLLVDNDIKGNSRIGVGSGGNTTDAAIYKISDTNTGIIWPAADTLAFTTAGAERIRIDSSGRVGIGTSSPSYALHVATNTGYIAEFQSTAGVNHRPVRWTNNSAATVGTLGADFTANEFILQAVGTPLVFGAGTSGAERMRITSSGNVGIGTTNPIMKLQVAGDIYSNGGNVFIDSGRQLKWGNSTQWIEATNDTSMEFAVGSAVRATILANGNIGIGTTTPTTQLEVGDTETSGTGITISARYDQSNALLTFRSGHPSNSNVWNTSQIGSTDDGNYNGRLDFRTSTSGQAAPSTKMTIKATGNVGIGTTAPASLLHVKGTQSYGSIRVSPTSTNGESAIAFFKDTAGTTTGTAWVVGHAGWGHTGDFVIGNEAFGGPIMLIEAGGNVGIGTTAPASKVHIKGNSNNTVSQANANLNVEGDGGNGLVIGTMVASTYASYIQSGYVDNFATAVYPLLLNPSGGNVGIGTTAPGYKLEVNGSFAATTKSFVIDHPTKEGMKLRYGSLEGPENGVYVRGRLKDSNVIELPDYWTGLVHEDSITVSLTAIGKSQELYVIDINDNKVTVSGNDSINCFYTIFAERKDVEKLEVEYK